MPATARPSTAPTAYSTSSFIPRFHRPEPYSTALPTPLEQSKRPLGLGLSSTNPSGSSPPRSPSRNGISSTDISKRRHTHSVSLSLAPAQGISSSASASALSSTGLNSSNSTSSPTSSSHTATARKRSSESAQRRISEDAEFEDLIRRGDTLHMTLTPSRFRPESGSRKSQTGKKASSGIAKLSGRSRGNSTSSSASANGSQSDSGLSASHRNGSSNGLSNFGLSNTSMNGANSHGSIPGVTKMRARSAVAPRRRLGEDEDSSSAADGAAHQDEEAEELDSEDEALLGVTAHVKRKRAAAAAAADAKSGKKESLFDILNSEPPWERDAGSSSSTQASSRTEPFLLASPASMAAKKSNSTTGLSRTEKGLGLSATGPNAGSRTAPLQVSRLQNQPAMSAPPTQRFAPIANLDIIGNLELSERRDETATLRGAPSIADAGSLNSTIAPSFDQGANASTDFFLPSGKADSIASTQGTANAQRQINGAPNTKPQLASYKSSPNLSSPSSGSDSAVSPSHWTSSAPSSASPAVPAFLAPKYSSASLGPAVPSSNSAGTRYRRLQAKDERSIGKDNNNDDLIAFLRNATPPPPPSTASAGLESALAVKGSNSSTTGKSRLGSSKFRSFLSGGGSSSKNRPSTASTVDNFARGSSTLPLRSNILGGNGLPAVDELGRNIAASSSLAASLTPLNRKLSKSRSREGLRAGSMPAYLPEGSGSSLPASSLLPASTIRGDSASGIGGGNLGWTAVVSSNGTAASPAAKQAHREWESANAAVDGLQQAAMDKYGYLPRIASASSPPAQDTQYKPYGFDGSYHAAPSQLVQREAVSHPAASSAYDAFSETRQQTSETPLLTPESSRDSLHRLSSTAKAISGFETPPDSPEQRTHSAKASHSPVQTTTAQYRALHSLPEEDADRPRTSTSTVSGSPSAVMPGMAHKHQRRLSAVRRKPSPRVEGEPQTMQQPQQPQQETINSARASPELKGLAITSTAPVVVSVSAQTTPLGGRSREPSVSSSHVSASSAVKLADAYHDGSSSTTVPPQALDAHSVASSKYTSNILNTVPRAPSLNSVASRPVSSMAIIVPLSPRHGNAQNASADIHDVLLSLRNNMISATSVVECLDMIDAALFEVAYDTNKLGYSPASTIEEETSFEQDKFQGQESDLKQSLVVEEMDIHGYGSTHRTPRYVSRAFGAIIDYYLSSLSSNIHILGYDASPTDQSTNVEDLDVNEEAAAATIPSLATAMTERTPSLGYSAGDSTSVESDDGSAPALAISAVDEDKNSYTLPPLPSGKVVSLSTEELSFIDSEEEQEILQKAVEAISAA